MTFPPQLVGLYSPVPECGKSTLARTLCSELHFPSEHGAVVLPFAGPLKAAAVKFLMSTLNMSEHDARFHCYTDKAAPIRGLMDATGRKVLQRLGEAGRQVDPDYWIYPWKQSAMALLGLDRRVIVDDMRHRNEARAMVDLGGEVWRIERAEAIANADPAVITHVSEGQLEEWPFDRRFSNDGTVEELILAVQESLHREPPKCRA
jgi:hypothetical protein